MTQQDWEFQQADIIQWRAAQKAKLTSIDKQMREIEERIRSHKVFLADRTLQLHSQAQLTDPELLKICGSISDMQSALETAKLEHETLAREQPPRPVARDLPTLGLVCPVDGKPLRARFCPEHGVEGVSMAAEGGASSASASAAPTQGAVLKCPVCGRTLTGRFCPDHGREGIPAE